MPRKRKAGKRRTAENLDNWGQGGAFSLLGNILQQIFNAQPY